MDKIKILGIVGSPRVGGNTEILVREALEAARINGGAVELIRLADKKISPCRGCRTCIEKRRLCVIQDDMQELYEKLMDADGIIVGSPVYLSQVTGQLKVFMDRTQPLTYGLGFKLKNKVGGAIVVGAERHGGQELTLQAINNFFLIHGMRLTINLPSAFLGVAAQGRLAGEVKADELGIECARAMGEEVLRLIKENKANNQL
jgi:multimeric flavodoxin WrbA